MSDVEERLQTICDLAAARLATLEARERAHGKNVNTDDFDSILHDLKEIVRLTEKTWR